MSIAAFDTLAFTDTVSGQTLEPAEFARITSFLRKQESSIV